MNKQSKQKKILVLAGGTDQVALILELKKRGYYTVLVDYYQEPPAHFYADKHLVVSTLDFDMVEEIARDENVELITTACTDQALLTMAYVSERVGLPTYISYQTALNVTNKQYMKKVMLESAIPTAKFVITDSVDCPNLSDFVYPLVVKPVDCNSSKGVKRVDTPNDLKVYLSEAISLSRTKTAVVEEFKSGEEVSVDFYVENGRTKLLSATQSIKIPNRKSFTIMGSVYPVVTSQQEQQLTAIAQQIADAFGLLNTPLLVQLIVNDKEMSVLEFSARMGGGSKYKLIEVLSGVNIMEKYVDLVLGQRPEIVPSKQVNFARMVYIYCKPGVFKEVVGFDQLKDEGVISEYFFYKVPGAHITGAETSGDRPAGYLITAETQSELHEKIKKAESVLKVLNMGGEDIMLHGLNK